jgi:hypothetical protein
MRIGDSLILCLRKTVAIDLAERSHQSPRCSWQSASHKNRNLALLALPVSCYL